MNKNLSNWMRNLISDEVRTFLYMNLKHRKHKCLNCGSWFKARSKYHHFCGKKCYQKLHRIPGFVRRVINAKD